MLPNNMCICKDSQEISSKSENGDLSQVSGVSAVLAAKSPVSAEPSAISAAKKIVKSIENLLCSCGNTISYDNMAFYILTMLQTGRSMVISGVNEKTGLPNGEHVISAIKLISMCMGMCFSLNNKGDCKVMNVWAKGNTGKCFSLRIKIENEEISYIFYLDSLHKVLDGENQQYVLF